MVQKSFQKGEKPGEEKDQVHGLGFGGWGEMERASGVAGLEVLGACIV